MGPERRRKDVQPTEKTHQVVGDDTRSVEIPGMWDDDRYKPPDPSPGPMCLSLILSVRLPSAPVDTSSSARPRVRPPVPFVPGRGPPDQSTEDPKGPHSCRPSVTPCWSGGLSSGLDDVGASGTSFLRSGPTKGPHDWVEVYGRRVRDAVEVVRL